MLDPRRLRPSELCRLLNSTPLGEVLNEWQLYRHRTRAGLRIGDARHVDLLRYVAWLVSIRHAPKREPESDPYETLKARALAQSIAQSIVEPIPTTKRSYRALATVEPLVPMS